MTRRDLLVRTGVIGAGVAAAAVVPAAWWRARGGGEPTPWDPDAFAPPGDATVAVLRATAYDDRLAGVVRDGIRASGVAVAGRRVLVKPNLVEYDAGTVINTDPRLVAAVVDALRSEGAAEVVVGEGPGHRRDTEYVAATSGLLDALGAVAADFVDLNAAALVPVDLRTAYTGLEQLWLPRPVVEADLVVSLPKMKTHHWAGVTLSLKNLFGTVPGRVYGWPKNVLHWKGIHQSILDIAGAVRPGLAIVDGVVGMEGNGPISGTAVPAGLLVFGADPVAVDTTGATLMGADPTRLPWLVEAGRFLGQSDPDRIRQVGEDPTALARRFTPPPGVNAAFTG